ncbi:MAG: MotE family protein [Alphaproteobacteria bacterium]
MQNKKKQKHIRILPIFIFFAFLMLSIRVSTVVDTINTSSDITLISHSQAENKTNKEEEELGKILDKNAANARNSTSDNPQGNVSDSEVRILQELAERREALEVRSREIDKKAIQLKVAEEQIEQKLAQLKAYETKLKNMMRDYEGKERQRIDALVKLYASMKPKDAARIFDTLDTEILVSLLSEMKPSASSAILSQMDVKKAKDVTDKLMGNEI